LAVLVTARFRWDPGTYRRWRRWLRTARCDCGVARPLHAEDHSPPSLRDIGRRAEPSLSRHRAGVACCPQHLVRGAGPRRQGWPAAGTRHRPRNSRLGPANGLRRVHATTCRPA